MRKYDVDKVDDIDNLPDGKKDMVISAILFGLTYISYKIVKNHAVYIFETTHTTKSLEAMISEVSFIIPISLLGCSIAELIIGLHDYFKKKKKLAKSKTLTKKRLKSGH